MIGIIIQARTKSTRFPRKIYEDLNGKCTLYRVLEGISRVKMPHKIILAMPEYDRDEFEKKLSAGEFVGAIDERFCTYFGSEEDVLLRYFEAANKYGLDTVIRVTADCPFAGVCIDEMLLKYMENDYNCFMGNNEAVSPNPFPRGVGAEIFPYWLLSVANMYAETKYFREHVTPYMMSSRAKNEIIGFLNNRPNSQVLMKYPDMSFDDEEDRQLLLKITKYYDDEVLAGASTIDALNAAIKKTDYKI